MNHIPRIIVLSILIVIGVVGVAYVAIMAYIHYDVFGKSPSYEGTRQNFINNELYFQKTEDCFQKIFQCCSSVDSTMELIRFTIDNSSNNFVFFQYFSIEDRRQLLFPIRDSGLEISQNQKETLQSNGITPQMIETLYSNLKKTNCRSVEKDKLNSNNTIFMTFKILDYCSIQYMFYPQPFEEDSIKSHISNTPLGRRVRIYVE